MKDSLSDQCYIDHVHDDTSYDALKRENSLLGSRVEEQEEQIEEQDSKILGHEEEIGELAGMIATHEYTIQDHEQQVENLETDIENYEVKVDYLENKLETRKEQEQDKAAEVDELMDKIIDLEATIEGQLQWRRGFIASLK